MKKLLIALFMMSTVLLNGQLLKPKVTKKTDLVVLPAERTDSNSVSYQLVEIVANAASNTGFYRVYNRQDLESLLNEQGLYQTGIVSENSILEFGKVASAQEVMIVKMIDFTEDKKILPDTRTVIPAVKNEAGKIITREKIVEKTGGELWTYSLYFSVKTVNLTTSETLNIFEVRSNGSNASKTTARVATITNARHKILLEFSKRHKLVSEVLEVDRWKNEVVLLLGENYGVQTGSIYQIVSGEEVKKFGEREITVPGRSVGFVRIDEVAKDASVGKIIRRWGTINPGYQAKIQPSFKNSSYIGIVVTENEYGIPFQFINDPFDKFEWRYGLQLASLTNTWDENLFSFGIPVSLSYKLIHSPRFTVGVTNNLYPNFIYATDFDDNKVMASRFKLTVGGELSYVSNPTRDIVLSAELTLFDNIGDWSTTKKDTLDNDIPIVWGEKGPIEILTPELTFRVGWKFLGKWGKKD
jgi:hypothetical protein